MIKRSLAAGLTAGVAACVFLSCRGGESAKPTPPPPGKGALYTLVTDAPSCDILALRLLVTGLSITTTDGLRAVPVFPQTAAIRVNLADLRDSSTVLNLASVTEGTYGEAALMLSIAQIAVFDPTQNPPISFVNVKLSNMNPKVPIQPPLTVTKNKVSAIRLDFDMPRSVEVDSRGQVTGNVTPVFKVTPLAASGTQGFAEFDDLKGFISSVTVTTSSGEFTGSFLLQLLGGTGPALQVSMTNGTQLLGVPALNQLPTGSFVELEGFVDENGNLVARSVEVEDREILEQNKVGFIGFVTSVTKDSNGKVTQFVLYSRGAEPDPIFDVSPDSFLVVNVSPSTVFQFSSRTTNFVNQPFDATALAVGQEVVVHGVFTKPSNPSGLLPAPLTTVAADKIYVKLQTHEGNFASLLQAASDDKTGAFVLAPCASLLRRAPLFVFTNSQTSFVNVSGLSALTRQPSLLVKGLLFFDAQGRVINGVTVPPGTLVLLAKQVHQL